MKTKSVKRQEALDRTKRGLASIKESLKNVIVQAKIHKGDARVLAQIRENQDHICRIIQRDEKHIAHLETLVERSRRS